jgi:hypothetical protein
VATKSVISKNVSVCLKYSHPPSEAITHYKIKVAVSNFGGGFRMTMKYVVPNIIKPGLGERVGLVLTLSRDELSKTGQNSPRLEYLTLANKIKHNTTAIYLPSRDKENKNDI